MGSVNPIRALVGALVLALGMTVAVVGGCEPADVSGTEVADGPFAIPEGDSALDALVLEATRTEDREAAGAALMRAGFMAYVKGDFLRAEALFADAAEEDAPDAVLWRGLALLGGARIEDAESALKRAQASASDPAAAAAASLGLAACELADGRVEEAAARCRGLVEAGGEGSASASIILQRCLFELGEEDQEAGVTEELRDRYPLSYELAVIDNIKRRPRPEEGPGAETSSEAAGGSTVEPGAAPADLSGETDPGGTAPGAPEPEGVEGRPDAEGARDDAKEERPTAERSDDETAGEGESGTSEFPSGGWVYSVQVGAFSDVRNAEALALRLAQREYDAVRVEMETRDDNVYHCVRAGRFASRSAAVSLASVIENEENLNTTIVRTIAPSSEPPPEQE